MNRPFGFVALLAVIAVSIIFGMVIGGKLNAPQVMLAAPEVTPMQLAPAALTVGPGSSFADIVEAAIPAVVSVTNQQVREAADAEDPREESPEQQFFRWFFGGPDSRRRGPQPRIGPRVGEGSGFIVSRDGYVLTNHHVVEDATRLIVGLQSGKQYEAQVVGTDPSIDLALLRLDPEGEELPILELGDSEQLRVGEWVIAIGNPLEYEHSVTVGVVSAKERRLQIGNTDAGVVRFIQTDAAINLGNSGGPLLDARGKVVGINTAITRVNFAEGIGFAVPINQARRAMQQLLEKGRVSRGYIGITMNQFPIDEETAEYYGLPDVNGVLVLRVADDGPAERAGVRPGDVIRKVNGFPVKDNLDLINKISSHQPGERVDLEIFREGKTSTRRAKLRDREEALDEEFNRRPTPTASPKIVHDEDTALGITVENLDRWRDRLEIDDDVHGVVTTDVAYDSEAADKRVQPNMIVTAINDEPIRNVSDWDRALKDLEPGTPVKLDLRFRDRGFYVFLRATEDND